MTIKKQLKFKGDIEITLSYFIIFDPRKNIGILISYINVSHVS